MKTIDIKEYKTPNMTLCEVTVERGFFGSEGGGGLTPPDMPGVGDELE